MGWNDESSTPDAGCGTPGQRLLLDHARHPRFVNRITVPESVVVSVAVTPEGEIVPPEIRVDSRMAMTASPPISLARSRVFRMTVLHGAKNLACDDMWPSSRNSQRGRWVS